MKLKVYRRYNKSSENNTQSRGLDKNYDERIDKLLQSSAACSVGRSVKS